MMCLTALQKVRVTLLVRVVLAPTRSIRQTSTQGVQPVASQRNREAGWLSSRPIYAARRSCSVAPSMIQSPRGITTHSYHSKHTMPSVYANMPRKAKFPALLHHPGTNSSCLGTGNVDKQ